MISSRVSGSKDRNRGRDDSQAATSSFDRQWDGRGGIRRFADAQCASRLDCFFNSPSDVVEKHLPAGTRIRLGGLVKNGTVVRGSNLSVGFEVTDGQRDGPVSYQGVLPDLFREGQGVVAEGVLDAGGTFKADSILAKHDETYMPKEVADALKRSGHWKDDYGRQAGAPGGGAIK